MFKTINSSKKNNVKYSQIICTVINNNFKPPNKIIIQKVKFMKKTNIYQPDIFAPYEINREINYKKTRDSNFKSFRPTNRKFSSQNLVITQGYQSETMRN